MARIDLPYPRSLTGFEGGGLSSLTTSSLMRNGLALVLSAALTSILGLGYWILAARLYPAEVLGLNAVMISSMITLANLAQLNLGNFLNRTLGGAGRSAGRIILTSYLMAVGSGVGFACLFILASQWLAPELTTAFSSYSMSFLFVVCTVFWTIFNLQDSVLAGLRQSVWVPLENGLFSTTKILLLAVLVGTQWTDLGPFLAWVTPTLLLIPAVSLLIARHILPGMQGAPAAPQRKVGEVAAMMGWDYLATIAMMLGLGIAPILVLQLAGSSAAAGYSIAWAITYSIYLVARSFGISMMAEAAADPGLRKSLAVRSLAMVTSLLLISAAGIVLLAPYVLLVFGKSYTGENIPLLRLLVLSAIPWGITTIYVAMARSAGRTGRIAIVQVATVSIFFAAAKLLVPLYGVPGIGFAWLAAHTLVFIAIVVAEGIFNPSEMKELVLLFISSGGRLSRKIRHKARNPAPSLSQEEAQATAALLTEHPANLTVRHAEIFDNDCQTWMVSGADGISRVYLKRTITETGRAALNHHVSVLVRLQHDLRDHPQLYLLPKILADVEGERHRFIVQQSMSGRSGRSFLQGRRGERALLSKACAAMAAIHSSNARTTFIAEEWLRQWIDEPLTSIAALDRNRLAKRKAESAIKRIRELQYAYWSGREVSLGWHHGDFSLGNIFFEAASELGGTAQVSGIIDWDGAMDRGPCSLDAWHLALTAESECRGAELGHVAAEFLWSEGAGLSFRPDRDLLHRDEPPLVMVTLAWLRHLHSNLSKSARYRQNVLWRMGNVDCVLDGFRRNGI